MIIISLNVVMRVMKNPIPGAIELSETMQVILVFMALAYTGLKKGHIAIDFLVQHFPRRAQFIFDIGANSVCLIFSLILTWQSVVQANYLVSNGTSTMMLHIPLSIIFWIIVAGSAALSLIYVEEILILLTAGDKVT